MTNAFYRVRPIAQALFEALFIVFIVFAGVADASATAGKQQEGLNAKTSINQQIGVGILQSRGTSATASISPPRRARSGRCPTLLWLAA